MRRAYTLLEVIVATSLLAGVLLSAGTLIPRSVLHMRNHTAEALAAQLANQVLEETRALAPSLVFDGTYDGASVTPDKTAPPLACPPSPYPACDIEVQEDGRTVRTHYVFSVLIESGPTFPPGTHHVNVKVSWHESAGGRWIPRQWDVDSYLLQ